MPSGLELINGHDDGNDARARRKQRLRRGEHERRRNAYTLGRQSMNGFDDVLDERNLDDDLVGELRELPRVAICLRCGERMHRDETGPSAVRQRSKRCSRSLSMSCSPIEHVRREHAIDQAAARCPEDVIDPRGCR